MIGTNSRKPESEAKFEEEPEELVYVYSHCRSDTSNKTNSKIPVRGTVSGEYGDLARLQFRRNIVSPVGPGASMIIEVIICSEFNECITGLLDLADIHFAVLPFDNGQALHSYDALYRTSLVPYNGSCAKQGDVLRVTLSVPTKVGFYQVFINGRISICSDRNVDAPSQLLPILSEPFEVRPHPSKSTALLTCYRKIFGTNLVMCEDYGAAIGSHVYDCSLILSEYIHELKKSGKTYSTLVELGAGCGLAGLYALLRFPSAVAILTDRSAQLQHLQQNVLINLTALEELRGRCSVKEFDWSNQSQLDDLKSIMNRNEPYLLLASDVMYDTSAALLLFKVLHELHGCSGDIDILIAQKNRQNLSRADAKYYVERLIGDQYFFTLDCMHARAGVIIWKISFNCT